MKLSGVVSFVVLMTAQISLAANCQIALTGNDQMKYDKASVTVDASCKEITITLVHVGKLPMAAMGHNVVISKEADKMSIATAGAGLGAAKNYVNASDAKVIAFTKVIGGGSKTETKFPGSKLKAGEKYVYFCTFPGHFAMMTGTLIVK